MNGPLALLWRLKVIGRLRAIRARMRSPLGCLSVVFGLLLVGGWLGSIILRTLTLERTGDAPSGEEIRLGLAAYLVFVTLSSLSLRGVYLPRAEVERLFAAPLGRASIVRYRLATSLFAALPFILVMAAFVAPRFDSLGCAVAALLVIVPTFTVVGQGISLLAAPTSGLVDRVLRRVPAGTLRTVGLLGLLGAFFAVGFGPGLATESELELREMIERMERGGRAPAPVEDAPGAFERIAKTPAVAALTTPLSPWARALGAPTLAAAAPWLAIITLLFAALFELVARAPIDFRESSLRTSQAFEKRIARARRGAGGHFGPEARTSRLRTPWLFGRSPAGAVSWLRIAWLVRQGRGTLLVAGIVLVLGLLAGTRFLTGGVGDASVIALLATIYLSSGLRTDFRADLDRLESIKAWPLPWPRIFVATVLPGTAVTTAVVLGILAGRAAVLRDAEPALGLVALAVPFAAYLWTAVDNVVFLLFPVRIQPGQAGGVHLAGRGVLLLFLRGLLAALFGGVVAAGAFVILALLGPGGGAPLTAALVAWVSIALVGVTWAVTRMGGWALGRFDVSRLPSAS